MGVGKLVQMATLNRLGSAARDVQERVSNTASGRGTGVNWEDYNYPPYVRLVHYDSDDVEVPEQKRTVQLANACYMLTLLALVLNVFSNLVLAFGGVEGKGVHTIYAMFNTIIVGVIGFFGFYHGYKGLATGNSRMTSRYLFVQLAMMVFMFVSSLVGASNFNGWLNVQRAKDANAMSGFWMGWTFFESTLWTALLALSALAFAMVFKHSDHTPSLVPF